MIFEDSTWEQKLHLEDIQIFRDRLLVEFICTDFSLSKQPKERYNWQKQHVIYRTNRQTTHPKQGLRSLLLHEKESCRLLWYSHSEVQLQKTNELVCKQKYN